MELSLTTLVNAFVLSSMYILVAVGIAFLFNMMGILNFAHGAIYMVAGYICAQFAVEYGLNQWISVLLTVILVGAFGVFLEKYCFRPFFGNFDRVVVVSIAIIVILETAVNVTVGAYVRTLPTFVLGVLRVGAVSLSAQRFIIFIIGGAVLAVILWFTRSTKLGQQMQAIAQNLDGAALQGISIHRISSLACAIACGLAALAGCLMSAILSLSPFMGDYVLIKAIEVVILGGLGNIGAILIAGSVVGTLDAVLPVVIGGSASEAIALGLIVVILLIRPQGFFGHEAG